MQLLPLFLLVTGILGVHANASTATSHAVLEPRKDRNPIVSAVVVQSADSVSSLEEVGKSTTVVDVTLAVTLTAPVVKVTSTALVETATSTTPSWAFTPTTSSWTLSSTTSSSTSTSTQSTSATTSAAWVWTDTWTSSPSPTTTTSSTSTSTLTSSNTKIIFADYTTVQWYESWVGGTYSTWFPTTIKVHPTSTSSNTKIIVTDYTTVKWYESWVGGTYSTWFPTTIEVHPASMSPAPRPGKGEIGMGTLTGELGVTQTVVVGAAATHAPRWVEGVAAAVGVGVVGALV